ncbi:MAG: hypothetical protein MUF00_00885 [Gemmatimonadaceae bacterium]|jgi:hypothetical protein|nr:hypothetical protein [Gemmatimonadaceae bacterium]
MTPARALLWIRLVHTLVWAIFATSIVLIPLWTHQGRLRGAAWLAAFVALECVVLVVNRMRCPLTDLAARYTTERHDNFDIYLPLWVARHNKTISGSLYALGLLYLGTRWVGAVR